MISTIELSGNRLALKFSYKRGDLLCVAIEEASLLIFIDAKFKKGTFWVRPAGAGHELAFETDAQ